MVCFAVYIPLIIVDPLLDPLLVQGSSSFSDLMGAILVGSGKVTCISHCRAIASACEKCVIEHGTSICYSLRRAESEVRSKSIGSGAKPKTRASSTVPSRPAR